MGNIYFYDFPIGKLGIKENGLAVTRIILPNQADAAQKMQGEWDLNTRETALIKVAAQQLDEYFSKERKAFTFPIHTNATPFQAIVWEALKNIPYGTMSSYGQIAKDIGKPKAYRAVGMANHRNPLPIIIPCHRVVGFNGSLIGYAGGVEAKKFLLELEKC